MSDSEANNSLKRDDLPPLHPLLNIDDPPVVKHESQRPSDAAPPPPPEPSDAGFEDHADAAHETDVADALAHEGDEEQRELEEEPIGGRRPVEPALIAASEKGFRPSTAMPSHPLRGKGRWIVAAVAVMTLIFIALIWREAGRIGDGGLVLQQWVRDHQAPLPESVADPQRLDIRPRRAIRAANFFGDAEYAYELWQPAADGDRLVAKYLLVYSGGEFKLQSAFDATTQHRMDVGK